MNKEEEAKELHRNGYNCAQGVLCAFFNELGVSEDVAYKLSEGLGGGMGCGEVCGAVSAATLFISYHASKGKGSNSKLNTYKEVSDYLEAWDQRYHSHMCKDLKGKEITCNELVGKAVALMIEKEF